LQEVWQVLREVRRTLRDVAEDLSYVRQRLQGALQVQHEPLPIQLWMLRRSKGLLQHDKRPLWPWSFPSQASERLPLAEERLLRSLQEPFSTRRGVAWLEFDILYCWPLHIFWSAQDTDAGKWRLSARPIVIDRTSVWKRGA
jgi:hypothetical protein